MRHGEDRDAPDQREHRLDVDARGLEKLVGDRAPHPGQEIPGLESHALEDDLPGERITVGVEPRRGKPQHPVSRPDLGARDDPAALDHAHGKAREIVFPLRIELS